MVQQYGVLFLKADLEDKDEVKSEEPVIEQPFQQLFVSCPDGLNVRYMLESHVGRYHSE